MHLIPDKLADRIAGAIVDLAYSKEENPKVAVEVLIGHGDCKIIVESSCITYDDYETIQDIVNRISNNNCHLDLTAVKQDIHLADNQSKELRCGDNGIFKGVPLTEEEKELSRIARDLYNKYKSDGKYILDKNKLIVCQSNANSEDIRNEYNEKGFYVIVNPLGDWTGGIDVDSGATNRKLGSDMAQSVTGGGLCGKDLSKADVSVNIYCFLKAQETKKIVTTCCAIGDTELDIHIGDYIEKVSYREIVETARKYIKSVGGFEEFACWGLF